MTAKGFHRRLEPMLVPAFDAVCDIVFRSEVLAMSKLVVVRMGRSGAVLGINEGQNVTGMTWSLQQNSTPFPAETGEMPQ
ncbi:hypothetical protein N7447_004519 [Penicillium robsamsonii]|uniref:uncharacterized protein n=1 Tax=Penicillium robsamsonii TaxID=1792511 RepID=UPI002547EE6C|nr:uncharacterized protein N7447_004519 [Penicillium robsamsonii]KAJ5827756.1 hypothetical protein N7447_004519 [Penicillium robsamsonii]